MSAPAAPSRHAARGLFALCGLCAAQIMAAAPHARADAPQVLTLEVAIDTARKHAPENDQARASVDAADARVDIARAPLRPQLRGALGYQRRSSHGAVTSVPSADGSGTSVVGGTGSGWRQRDAFSASLDASLLMYDFGQTENGMRAAEARAGAEVEDARSSWLAVETSVRSAFLAAAATRALLDVARETLSNQERHLAQIEGFVEVGTRPAIDLAQSRTEVANARLDLLRADNDYALARRQLDRSMGKNPFGDYEISGELPGPEPDEDASVERLVAHAEGNRPEFASLRRQLRAQDYTISANEAGYAPSLQAVGNLQESGADLDALGFNAGVGVNLSWPIFQGGLVDARVREARAQLAGLRAQEEVLHKDTVLEIEQAVLSLRAALARRGIADEVVVNASERLALAEGRYSTGVGSIIELGDAQLVLSQAKAQRVGADYDLGQARVQLRHALGRTSAPPR